LLSVAANQNLAHGQKEEIGGAKGKLRPHLVVSVFEHFPIISYKYHINTEHFSFKNAFK